MNKEQLEMLSVKSAVERTVLAHISVCQTQDYQQSDKLFDQIDRYMASLYVSAQIQRGYSVQFTQSGDLEVKFDVGAHKTAITFKLPNGLRLQKPVVVAPKPVNKQDPVVSDFFISMMEILDRMDLDSKDEMTINHELQYRLHDHPKNGACDYWFSLVKTKLNGKVHITGEVNLQPHQDSETIVLPISLVQ